MRSYLNLVGDGTCTDPTIVIRWCGHEFGHVIVPPNDLVANAVVEEMGVWPIIDFMLMRLYGEMSEEERIAWYELHATDVVEITAPPHPKPRELTVFRWSDNMQFRPVNEVLETEVMPELAQVWGKRRAPSGSKEEAH